MCLLHWFYCCLLKGVGSSGYDTRSYSDIFWILFNRLQLQNGKCYTRRVSYKENKDASLFQTFIQDTLTDKSRWKAEEDGDFTSWAQSGTYFVTWCKSTLPSCFKAFNVNIYIFYSTHPPLFFLCVFLLHNSAEAFTRAVSGWKIVQIHVNWRQSICRSPK